MIQATEPTRKATVLEKNAVTGRTVLETRLQRLSDIQQKKFLFDNHEEKAVLKYNTGKGACSPLPDNYTSFALRYNTAKHRLSLPQAGASLSSPEKVFNGNKAISPSAAHAYTPKYNVQNDFKIPPDLVEIHHNSFPTYSPRCYPPSVEISELANVATPRKVPGLPNRYGMSGGVRFPPPLDPDAKMTMPNGFHNDLTYEMLHQSNSPKATMSPKRYMSNSSMIFSPSSHYTSTVSKSMSYQTWSNSLAPSAAARPGSAKPTAAANGISTTTTSTFNSFLRRMSEGNGLKQYQPAVSDTGLMLANGDMGMKLGGLTEARQTVFTPPLPYQPSFGKSDLAAPLPGDVDDALRDIAITNSTPRAKLLVSSNSAASKPPTGFNTPRRRVPGSVSAAKLASNISSSSNNIIHGRSHMQGGHVSSIPNQNSRTISDNSFTVQNSSKPMLLKQQGAQKRIGSARRSYVTDSGGRVQNGTSKRTSRAGSSKRVRSRAKTPASGNATMAGNEPADESGLDANGNPSKIESPDSVREVSKTFHDMKFTPRHKSEYRVASPQRNPQPGQLKRPYMYEAKKPLHAVVRLTSSNRAQLKKSMRHSEQGDSMNEAGMNGSTTGQTSDLLKQASARLGAYVSHKQGSPSSSDTRREVASSQDVTADYEEEDEDAASMQEEAEMDNEEDEVNDEFVDEMIDGASCCQDADDYYADDNDIDCVDDSAMNCLDDDDVISEAAESEYSVATSASNSTNVSNADSEKKAQKEQMVTKPALISSMFSNCPPVINFGTKHEKVESLPHDTRKLLRWKMSPITPIVVRNTVARSGFKPSRKNHDWTGYFGKHMKASGFRSLREYQKINHFPGSFQLGRKDRLWRNLSRMQARFGKKEFGFIPQSFILPWDKKLLKTAWDEGGTKQKYILKPPASARGIGIRIIHKWNQIPTRRPILVQKYLARPLLLNGCKFDLRLYVYVTSFDPLRIYLFDDGLVRFATCKYSTSMKHLSNRFMHLTNYSINKKSGDFQQNDDASVCQGHKWSMKALWSYLEERGYNTKKIWEQMKDICIKTIISVEHFTNSLVKANCRRRSCCHELFGFDIMLDDRLRPWILEVNISPSLHSNSPLDVEIKGQMVSDMFNLAGFQVPDKKVINANAPAPNNSMSSISAAASFSQDKRKQSQEVTYDTRSKHTYFAQHHKQLDEVELMCMMLDVLTTNDIQMLVESEEENSRRGRFQRIFPGGDETKKYFQYFEQPRYYNFLLHLWELKYQHQRQRGIALLESYCRRGLHRPDLMQGHAYTVPAEHVWTMPPQFKPFASPRTDPKYLPMVIKASSVTSLYSPSPTATSSVVTSAGRITSAKRCETSSTKSLASVASVQVRVATGRSDK